MSCGPSYSRSSKRFGIIGLVVDVTVIILKDLSTDPKLQTCMKNEWLLPSTISWRLLSSAAASAAAASTTAASASATTPATAAPPSSLSCSASLSASGHYAVAHRIPICRTSCVCHPCTSAMATAIRWALL